MRCNDVTKSIPETLTLEMGNIDAPVLPLHNQNMISKENITGNCVRRKRAKTKNSVMPGIGLNNSMKEATHRMERKS